MVRYADDFVVMCESAEQADEALQLIKQWMSRMRLRLHPDKTQVVDTERKGEEFGFLGYRFKDGNRYPRHKSKKRFKEQIREQTRRTNGDSLEVIISRLNHMSRGWFEYFKHCHHNVFQAMDGWIRRRLRSLLRKRKNLSGGPNRRDNLRWSNHFFAVKGLFSMETAFRRMIQSLREG
jgi:RNA-directed DNA polymerase